MTFKEINDKLTIKTIISIFFKSAGLQHLLGDGEGSSAAVGGDHSVQSNIINKQKIRFGKCRVQTFCQTVGANDLHCKY